MSHEDIQATWNPPISEIGEILVQLHQIEAETEVRPERKQKLMLEHEELGSKIGLVVERRPYLLTRLKKKETGNFDALEEILRNESLRSEETVAAIGRSAIILLEIAKLQNNKPAPVKVIAVAEHIRAEAEKKKPFKVTLDANNKVKINDTQIELTPRERYIFEALLDTKGPIRKKDIYDNDEFAKLGVSGSRHFFAFRNTYISLSRKLTAAGLPDFAKDAITEDGRRDKENLQRIAEIEVEDKYSMSRVDEIVEVLIKSFQDDIEGGSRQIASIFFGIPESSVRVRHTKVVDAALQILTTALEEARKKHLKQSNA